MKTHRIAIIALLLASVAAFAAPGGTLVDVIVDRPSISPNGDGIADSTGVRLLLDADLDSLRAVVRDPSSSVPVALLLEAAPAPAGEHAASWSGLDDFGSPVPDGVWELAVFARSGTETETIVRELVVDRVAPIVRIDRLEPGLLAPGAPGAPESIAVYLTLGEWSEATTLAATATPPGGEAAPIAVPARVAGDGQHRFAWYPGAAPADGVWTLAFAATDEAGNTGRDEGHVDIDASGPSIAFVDSIPPSSREPSTVVTGCCHDGRGVAAPVFTVTTSGNVSPGQSADSTWTAGDTLCWRIDVFDLVAVGGQFIDGTYVFKARCADRLGNESEASFTFRIDRTSPAAPVLVEPLSPVRDPGLALGVELNANETDSLFVYRTAGSSTDVFAKRVALSSFTIDVTLLEGTNTLRAYAQDEAGNVSGPSNAVEVVLDTSLGVSFPEAFRGPDVFSVRTPDPARLVEIDIFDLAGGAVRSLRAFGPSTAFSIEWDLLNDDGEEVNNGPFLLVVTVDGRSEKHFIAVVRGE
ncbi:MAG: hypothetical protein JW876_00045 [Candidatus Krumholzibacteriota bacterium]|nr:hypothetical protein [Candidatus Krumholzibacteriota bacterium]